MSAAPNRAQEALALLATLSGAAAGLPPRAAERGRRSPEESINKLHAPRGTPTDFSGNRPSSRRAGEA